MKQNRAGFQTKHAAFFYCLKLPSCPPGGLFQLLQRHKKRGEQKSRSLHAALNEPAPRDIKVVSEKENCTAYQTVTIRPHILPKNDPLHLGLGGERQRGMWRKVCRGADCILYRRSFEVISMKAKTPSLPAGPHYFFFISISHCCHLKHILLSPILLSLSLSLALSAFHLHFPTASPFTPSNHRSNLNPPCQYLSGQLSV